MEPESKIVDLVILTPESTAETLSQALSMIERERARVGYEPNLELQVEISGVRSSPMQAAHRQAMEGLLEQLRNAPMRTIEGIGTVRAVDYRTHPRSPPPPE